MVKVDLFTPSQLDDRTTFQWLSALICFQNFSENLGFDVMLSCWFRDFVWDHWTSEEENSKIFEKKNNVSPEYHLYTTCLVGDDIVTDYSHPFNWWLNLILQPLYQSSDYLIIKACDCLEPTGESRGVAIGTVTAVSLRKASAYDIMSWIIWWCRIFWSEKKEQSLKDNTHPWMKM